MSKGRLYIPQPRKPLTAEERSVMQQSSFWARHVNAHQANRQRLIEQAARQGNFLQRWLRKLRAFCTRLGGGQ